MPRTRTNTGGPVCADAACSTGRNVRPDHTLEGSQILAHGLASCKRVFASIPTFGFPFTKPSGAEQLRRTAALGRKSTTVTMTLEEYLRPAPHQRLAKPSSIWMPTAKSRGSRRISLRSKFHAAGALVAHRYTTAFESDLERKAVLRALAWPGVIDVIDQYPRARYLGDDGNWHTHTFDYLVLFDDGSKTAVSVKPEGLVLTSDIRRIHELLAAQMSPLAANRIALVTERHLGPVDCFNAELIHAVRRHPDAADYAVVDGLAAGLIGSTAIGMLVKASGLKGYGFNAIVLLIAAGRLRMTRHERISYDAIVCRPNWNA